MPINSEGREEIKIFFPDLEKKAQKLWIYQLQCV